MANASGDVAKLKVRCAALLSHVTNYILEANWEVVCGVLTLSVRLVAYGSGHVPDSEKSKMKNEHLKVSIEVLKALRDEKHQELSAGIIEEIDAVIRNLEGCLVDEEGEVKVPFSLACQCLKVMNEAIAVVTNLNKLIHIFFGSQ